MITSTNPAPLPTGVSVVVPVSNSAAILPDLVGRLGPVLQSLGTPHELLLVNDGSPDASWKVIGQLADRHPWIRGVRMMRNYGQHNALLAGLRLARFNTVITLDDDLQHPPEVLPRLLAGLTEGVDVVYGAPESEQHGVVRDLASVVTKMALGSAMGAETARMVNALRVFRTSLRSSFEAYSSPFVSIDVLLTCGTTRLTAIRVRHDP